jgi:hypothetical protein
MRFERAGLRFARAGVAPAPGWVEKNNLYFFRWFWHRRAIEAASMPAASNDTFRRA